MSLINELEIYAPSTSQQGPKRRRVTKEGVAVLEEYLRNNPFVRNELPGRAQREILLEQIHAKPGCETWDYDSLTAWFQRRRKAAADKLRKATQASSSSPYPSLTPVSTRHLRILSQGQLNPSTEVIQLWVNLLNAEYEDVIAWLSDQHRNENGPQNHLPTPVSTSPEPSEHWDADSSYSFKTDPLNSPVVPSFNPITHFRATTQENGPLPRRGLLEAIAYAASMAPLSIKPPNTAEEFNEMFDPYAEQMETIIRKNMEYLKQNSPPHVS